MLENITFDKILIQLAYVTNKQKVKKTRKGELKWQSIQQELTQKETMRQTL